MQMLEKIFDWRNYDDDQFICRYIQTEFRTNKCKKNYLR